MATKSNDTDALSIDPWDIFMDLLKASEAASAELGDVIDRDDAAGNRDRDLETHRLAVLDRLNNAVEQAHAFRRYLAHQVIDRIAKK